MVETGCQPRCPHTAAATESTTVDAQDKWNTTYYPSGQDAANERKPWYIIDAEGQTLGRLATLAATHIRCDPWTLLAHASTTQCACCTVEHAHAQHLADHAPLIMHTLSNTLSNTLSTTMHRLTLLSQG